MKLSRKIIAAAVCSLIATTGFAADEDGWYVGVSGNRISADFEDSNDVDFDDSDTAFGFRAGYMFTDFIGIEAGYLDLGDFSARGDRPRNRLDIDGNAYSLSAIFNWSVHEQIDVYAKAGAYRLEVNSDSRVAGFGLREDASETEPYAGVGVEWDLGTLNLFTEFSVVDTDVNDLTLDVLSAGVKFEL